MSLPRPKKPKPKKLKQPCHYCARRSTVKRECLTCEQTGKDVFTIHTCDRHHEQGLAEIRKHALAGHPVNILRGVVAALKGEDVF